MTNHVELSTLKTITVSVRTPEERKSVVSALPQSPGIYMFRDEQGEILYVGKSHNLKSRIATYFQRPELGLKVHHLSAETATLEWVVTDTEAEALLLENNLIKLHRPRFNVRLKDDKQYPYLRLDIHDDFPKLTVVRRIENDGSVYFGPYYSTKAMRSTLRLVYRHFYLRRCKGSITGKETRHCLMGDMRWCSAPCVGTIDREGYAALIKDVRMLLEGRSDKLVQELTTRMYEASAALKFELAAKIRDQIQAVRKVTQQQKVVLQDLKDRDVIAVAHKGEGAILSVYQIRFGRIVGRDQRLLEVGPSVDEPSLMEDCVRRYYEVQPLVPPEVILRTPVMAADDLAAWLGQLRGGRVRIRVPRRGTTASLAKMVERDAMIRLTFEGKQGAQYHIHTLESIKQRLDLPSVPKTIEAYDISNLQGAMAVGSMITFVNGEPAKDRYRRFKIKTVAQIDDYAMMQEMLSRRLKRREQKGWSLPDLLLIDGGLGHLHAVITVVTDEHIENLELVALAKVRSSRQIEGFFRPGKAAAILLPEGSPELNLLLHIRDEAHRFAVEYHRTLRKKAGIRSILDDAPGIGPKRKIALIKQFGSVKRLNAASYQELVKVPGMTAKLAAAVRNFLDGLQAVDSTAEADESSDDLLI